MSKRAGAILLMLSAGLCISAPAAAQQPAKKEEKIERRATEPKHAEVKRASGVGSVNLQKILTVLGLTAQLESRREALEQQYLFVQKEQQAAFDLKKKEFGEHPTPEQVKELTKAYDEASETVNRTRDRADKQMNELNNYALNVLKSKASGPISEIAEKRGLAVVMLQPNAGVVYTSNDADITDEVLEMIRSSSPSGLNSEIPSSQDLPEAGNVPPTPLRPADVINQILAPKGEKPKPNKIGPGVKK